MPRKKDLRYTDFVDICAASLRQSTVAIAAEYGITAQRVRQILNDNSELVERFKLAYADAVTQEIVKHASETDSLEEVDARAQDLIDDRKDRD